MSEQSEQLYDTLLMLAWTMNTTKCSGEGCEDFTLVDFLALKIVHEHQDCPIQTLGKKLSMTKSGATRVVKRLEKRGLLDIRCCTSDGRVRCLELTEEGLSCLNSIKEFQSSRVEASLEASLEAMDAEQIRQLEAGLQNLLNSLKT
jgi:DNA-binding MarR family transcriptional regulator